MNEKRIQDLTRRIFRIGRPFDIHVRGNHGSVEDPHFEVTFWIYADDTESLEAALDIAKTEDLHAKPFREGIGLTNL